MIFRPIAGRRLWDTWLFPWENRYHLFFLESHHKNGDYVGHAISEDLIHWQALKSIQTRGSEGSWNSSTTLTGCVVHHQGLFYMFVGAYDDVECIGVYTSPDLETWQACPDNPILKPKGPYYCETCSPFIWPVDWRDPDIVWRQEDKHYHAVVCARLPKWGHDNTGAALGHLRSKDLIHWEYLPPFATPGEYFFHTEVPSIFELGGRFYLAFNTASLGGIKIDTPSREHAIGSFYLVAERYEGPYKLPDDPLLIGSGQGRRDACCARTIEYQGGRLLYHHIDAKRPTWGSPKIVQTRVDGSLWLQYTPILEKLETETIPTSLNDVFKIVSSDMGIWKKYHDGLCGKAKVVGTAYKLAGEVADLHFQCKISMIFKTGCAGVVFRGFNGERGVAITLNFTKQRIEISNATGETFEMKGYDSNFGWTTMMRDSTSCSLTQGQSYHLRCFVRDEHFEAYLDDRWIFTTVMKDAPKKGDVELCVERGEATFTNLRLVNIEPFA